MKTDKLTPHLTRGAAITQIPGGFRLSIPQSRNREYLLAQLDDYTHIARRKFPHHSLNLRLDARVSARSIPGTWGFGVWNDPFGLNLGFTGSAIRIPALPNAAWFFHASPQNYLSFRDDKPAQGFLAQTFRSPRFDIRLASVALTLPFAPKTARRLLSRVIGEDGLQLELDMTQWHSYKINWDKNRVAFELDEAVVLETTLVPNPPLGMVIWIDNQYAAYTPQGKIGFGIVQNPEPAWLEVKNIDY